ncbi:prepilin-type N-terminal cleavage/methylation domain-containing protein [Tepidiphilus margaritifer]|uniref:prepilin-type N-terminal cleavage/methylation domain-containing protein n=1 Tax=Tepidiphilus margaritifer TaxID=203471 RepID=UPI00040B5F25|nr:prepilin-type N-terminal cleavage/methylation domain-containing protein [Tepidiphilus margaritifer]
MKIPSHASRRQLGLTLVELMVALVLGLVVIGAVVNLFLTNRQTYRTTENLARMQENLRIAFELMARDVREAGATACGIVYDTNKKYVVANVFNGASFTWVWQESPLFAYEPGATIPSPPDKVAAGSPVLSIVKASDPANEVHVVKHDESSDLLTLSSTANLEAGDIVFVCKAPYAAIFQVTNDPNPSRRTVSHATPANCIDYFVSYSFTCKNKASDNAKVSFSDGTIVKLQRIFWYVGTNDRGGTSLYRKVVNNDLDKNAPVEMVPDIDQLTLSFLSTGGTTYQPIASVADWTQVVAVRILVRSVSTDNIGTDSQPLRREYPFTIALRNRESLNR